MAKAIVKYVPEQCDGEGALFSGFVEIKKPSYEEFINNQSVLQKKEEESDVEYQKRLCEYASPLVQKMELKHIDGSEYSSMSDLLDDVEAMPIVGDIALACYFGPSKKKAITKAMKTPHSGEELNNKSPSSTNTEKPLEPQSQTSEPLT